MQSADVRELATIRRKTEKSKEVQVGMHQSADQSFPLEKHRTYRWQQGLAAVTHINSASECSEFHSHSLMKINEENGRLSSISHYFS